MIKRKCQTQHNTSGSHKRRLLTHVAIVRANAYQLNKFQLSRLISFGNMRGSQNKKWALLISVDAPYRTSFILGASTRKCLQVC